MSTRFAVKKRHVLIGITALSLAGAGLSVFHALTTGDEFEYTAANSTAIERTPAKASSQGYLNEQAGQMFALSGKQDRADRTSRTTASADEAAGTQTASVEAASSRHNVPIIAASFTPVEMIRGGPTRFANALQKQNVNRDGKTDRLDTAQHVAKTVAYNAEPSGRGTSAAMFLLSPPTGYDGEPIGDDSQPEAVTAKANTNKATWDDMVKLARVTGGDGEKIEEGIFGNLTENEFRAREFRCMATAIYHEARGESHDGQVAVGQVILTRVRSDYYPNTICGVVYQGQWNRNACQFSFACDGRSDAPKNGKLWDVSIDVAKKVITGKAFIKDIAEATHYHATYVSPKWRLKMNKLKRIGVHIFYKADFVRPLIASTDLDDL
jgi:spore germination cell wall hydrolase CwlJ-like protein